MSSLRSTSSSDKTGRAAVSLPRNTHEQRTHASWSHSFHVRSAKDVRSLLCRSSFAIAKGFETKRCRAFSPKHPCLFEKQKGLCLVAPCQVDQSMYKTEAV